jgi:hypothetical protein
MFVNRATRSFFKASKQFTNHSNLLQRSTSTLSFPIRISESKRNYSYVAAAAASAIFAASMVLQQQEKQETQEEDVIVSSPLAGEYLKTDDGEVPIYRIVLTGGPCGGKSSAMTKLSERLQSLGYQVFIVCIMDIVVVFNLCVNICVLGN